MVNKITWQKAGGVTEPGRYMFTFGWLTVTADDLAVWKMYPDAAFTLVKLPGGKADALEPGARHDQRVGRANRAAIG